MFDVVHRRELTARNCFEVVRTIAVRSHMIRQLDAMGQLKLQEVTLVQE
jgi:hypothetical protein